MKKSKLKKVWYYIEVYFSKILRLFGFVKSEDPIPKDTLYCYVIDEERNKKEPIKGYWIKTCKYYRKLDKDDAGCTYVGFVGFDICLSDQCKICGVKTDYKFENEKESSK